MVKFVIIQEGFYPDQIAFLKDDYSIVPGSDEEMFETKDEFISDLEALERAEIVRIVRDFETIEKPIDILRNTEKVEMLQGGTAMLRVHILGHIWEFTENELLGPTAVEKRLFRLKKAIYVKRDEWQMILTNWFNRAEDIKEISEEDEAREKILVYLSQCTIYKDIDKASAMYTLYYDENHSKIVYSLSDNMARVGESIPWYKAKNNSDGGGLSLQKMGWLLSDYIDNPSIQLTCNGKKKRFWRVYIDKANIDMEERMYKEDEDETVLLRPQRDDERDGKSRDTQSETTFNGNDGGDDIFEFDDEDEANDDCEDNTEYESNNSSKDGSSNSVTHKNTASATDDLGFKIFCYINKNGEASINDIYHAFPNVLSNKINADIRLMELQQKVYRISDADGGYECGGTSIFKTTRGKND